MNKERMLAVADFIEKENATRKRLEETHGWSSDYVEFDMQTWLTLPRADSKVKTLVKNGWCGTSACIGGTAAILEMTEKYEASRKEIGSRNIDAVPTNAEKYLDLTYRQADDLFYARKLCDQVPIGEKFTYINDRRDLVPNALRWMVDHDRVDWKKALDAAEKAERCGQRKAAREAKKARKAAPVQEDA